MFAVEVATVTSSSVMIDWLISCGHVTLPSCDQATTAQWPLIGKLAETINNDKEPQIISKQNQTK